LHVIILLCHDKQNICNNLPVTPAARQKHRSTREASQSGFLDLRQIYLWFNQSDVSPNTLQVLLEVRKLFIELTLFG